MEKEQKFKSPENNEQLDSDSAKKFPEKIITETGEPSIEVYREYPSQVEKKHPIDDPNITGVVGIIESQTRGNDLWATKAFMMWKESKLAGKSLSPTECVSLAWKEIAHEKGDTESI